LRKRSPSILAIAAALIVIVLAAVAYGMFQVVNGLGRLQAGASDQPTAAPLGPNINAGAAKEITSGPTAVAPGQLKWRWMRGSFYHAPLVTDSAVYVGLSEHTAYSLDLKTGQERWVTPLPGNVEGVSPAISGTTVLIATQNKYVCALDGNSGKQRWKTKIDTPTGVNSQLLTGPAVVSGLAVVGSSDGMLRAVDVATGQQRWELMAGYEDVPPFPVSGGGVVVFASYGQSVGAVDPSAGKSLWHRDLDGELGGLPCIADGIAYFRTTSTMYALDLKTGARRWSVDVLAWGGQNQGILPSPAAGDGIVCYPGEGNSLVALDANSGKQLWTFEAKGPVASPAVGQGMVCFGSQDSTVYGLDAKTGHQLWACVVGEPLLTQTTLSNGVAYVGGLKGSLFAVQAVPPK